MPRLSYLCADPTASGLSQALEEGEITFSWANPAGTVAVQAEVWRKHGGSFKRIDDDIDLTAPFMSSISYAPSEAGSYLVEVWTSTNGTCSSLYRHTKAVSVAEHQLKCPKPDQHRHGADPCGDDHSAPPCDPTRDQQWDDHTAHHLGGGPAHTKKTVPASGCSDFASPEPFTVVCGADGKLRASWGGYVGNPVAVMAIEGDRSFATDRPSDLEAVWDDVVPLATYELRGRVEIFPVGKPSLYSPWTAWKTATCPVFVPQNVSDSCNSHGVVKLDWDPVSGADLYQVDGINYEGPSTVVYAQRSEGHSYEFKVKARPSGGDWGQGWSDAASVSCPALDPDKPKYPAWKSPRGSLHTVCDERGSYCTSVWLNPLLDRYVLGETTAMGSGVDNCTSPEPKAGGGWIRTCTVYWTEEPVYVPLTDDFIRNVDHGSDDDHGSERLHIYRDPDDESIAATAKHRHCLKHDVNGDGDTDDPGDNDGTCPGPDTDVPDLAWHPTLPNAADPWWKTSAESNLLTTAGSAAAGGGAKWLVRFASASTAAKYGRFAGWIGAGAAFGAGFFYSWWKNKDNQPTIPIAGVNGCLDPGDTDWDADRWEMRTKTLTTTKEAHTYETKIIHEIAYCVNRS